MTLVINRPCGTCSHAVVCRIRAELEAVLVNDPAVVPLVLDPALEYDVSIDISCRYFLDTAAVAARRDEPEAVAPIEEATSELEAVVETRPDHASDIPRDIPDELPSSKPLPARRQMPTCRASSSGPLARSRNPRPSRRR
jgi:hypothetical protein